MKLFLLSLGVFALTFSAHAQLADIENGCSDAKVLAFQRSTPQARVTANRGADQYDIHFYHIDLNVSNTSTTLSGNVRFDARVLSTTLDTFWFELRSFMTVDSVLINGVRLNHLRVNDVVQVPLADVMQQGQAISCKVFYNGTPASSGFFSGITSSNGVTWTLSEPFSGPDWLPCKQDLWDKIDSSWFFATCNSGLKVGSQGLLTNVVTLPNNKVRYEWKTREKMAFYLIAFAVANYEEYVNWAKPAAMNGDSIFIQHYIYNGTLATNRTGLDRTPKMVEEFSDMFGLYPFHREKYGHMQANLGGGMEHQTMSTMGGFSQDLTSHELAHQWFGDKVTCATWSDIWLNEGWASYLEYLYRQTLSQSTADSWMTATHNSARGATTGSVYVPAGASVGRIFSSSLTYKKGAAVLHMLRYVMGDSAFFAGANEYLRIKGDTVSTTDEFRAIMEQSHGSSLQDFFNEWVYGEGFPNYTVRWNQVDSTLYVRLTQTTSAANPTGFSLKVPLRVSFPGRADTLLIDPAQLVNTFAIRGTVGAMALDPQNIILKGNSFITRDNTLGVGVEEYDWSALKIYPNPTEGRIKIAYDAAADYSLRDLQGREIQRGSIVAGESELDLLAVPGVYLLVINNGKAVKTERLVIR